ncbi:9179_t:CDS:1, partial [Paraglomus brasilianum]
MLRKKSQAKTRNTKVTTKRTNINENTSMSQPSPSPPINKRRKPGKPLFIRYKQ